MIVGAYLIEEDEGVCLEVQERHVVRLRCNNNATVTAADAVYVAKRTKEQNLTLSEKRLLEFPPDSKNMIGYRKEFRIV